jgi:hypothetical protein
MTRGPSVTQETAPPGAEGRRPLRWAARTAGALAVVGAAAVVSLSASAPHAVAADLKDWRAAARKVDDLVSAKHRAQKDLLVAPRSDDAEFLRRATLDLTGTIPTYAETVAFLQDPLPEKRDVLVDRLLASPRHAEWFTIWYGNLLVGTEVARNRTVDRGTFNDWLRDQFRKNRPYDEMVYDLVTATGNSETNGAVGLMSSFELSAADAAGKTARYFMGVQIQCAQCHDHPYDKRIKQDDFESFAAFFLTTTYRRNMAPGGGETSFDVNTYALDAARGGRSGAMGMMGQGQRLTLDGQRRPARGPFSVPDAKFLLGKVVKDSAIDRRQVLGRWLTSKSNEWFSTAFANRMWAYLTGRGLVHPVDDFSQQNKPSNPELLKHLADEFARSGFDVNHLIRSIVASETYQRSSKMPRGLERPDASLHAVGPVKPLSVEQSLDALLRATGFEADFEERARNQRTQMRAEGRRGLGDPKLFYYRLFRRSFDDDEQAVDETFTGTIPRGLLMMNNDVINGMMTSNRMRPLGQMLHEVRSDRERIRRTYLTVLSREPSPGELSNALQHVHTSRSEQEGYEDLLWALCNTTEFMSNH